MDSENTCDFLGKFLLIGDSNVGKSSILLRFTDDCFSETFSSTIGVGFKTRTLQVKSGRRVKIQIWDTAGQERFRAITHNSYRNAKGIFVVFDVTNQHSFDNVDSWYQSVMKMARGARVVLVGNKNDLVHNRQVSHATALQYSMRLGVDYVETSAKESYNIQKIFTMMASSLVEDHDANDAKLTAANSIGTEALVDENNLVFESVPVDAGRKNKTCSSC